VPDTSDQALRQQLVALLRGGQAHATFADAVAGFPVERAGEKPAQLPYSAWQILEHIRIVLRDLIDFVTNSAYEEQEWPAAYWPKQAAPQDAESWQQSVKAIHADLKMFEDLVSKPESNLYSAVPWGKHGETLLREVLLAADHTSYHVGELIVLRRLLGAWKQ
jgi:uncharacterized damage-inducible protein DinB